MEDIKDHIYNTLNRQKIFLQKLFAIFFMFFLSAPGLSAFSNLILNGSVLSELNYFNKNLDSFLFKYIEFEEREKHTCLMSNHLKTNLELSNSYQINFRLNSNITNNLVLNSDDNSKVETNEFLINELYTEVNFYDYVYLRMGKQRIKWGSGWIYNPSDFINPPKNPLSQIQTVEGIPGIKLEFISQYISIMAFGIVFDYLEYMGSGGKISSSVIPFTDIALSVYYSQKDHISGALNITTSPFYSLPYLDAWSFWFEGCLYTKSRYPRIKYRFKNTGLQSIKYIDPETSDSLADLKFTFLTGTQFQFPEANTVLMCEYYFIQEAYEAYEINVIYQYLRDSNPQVRQKSSGWTEIPDRKQARFSRQYLSVSLNQPSFTDSINIVSDNIGLSHSFILNLEDLSFFLRNSISTTIITNSKLTLSNWIANGKEKSEFYNSPTMLGFSFSIEIYF